MTDKIVIEAEKIEIHQSPKEDTFFDGFLNLVKAIGSLLIGGTLLYLVYGLFF